MENMVTILEHFRQVYKDKKVFVTGHTGFKGGWLLNIFSVLGAQVKGYSLSPKTPDDIYNVVEGDSLCESVIADIRERKKLIEEVKSFQPDFIFHMAAQPLVRLSYSIPAETFEVNAIGTANLLDAVRELDHPCHIVLITTDKVYHNYEWSYSYRENDRLGGYDPYSASKACAELIIDSYRKSFFNPSDFNFHKKGIAVARAGNVIGGGDWSENRLLPDIARALGKSETIIVRNPSAVRPWQHVLEPLSGYLRLGAKLANDPTVYGHPYNFGPYNEDALNVETMVKLAIDNWGSGEFVVGNEQTKMHEAGLLKLDIVKVQEELQWKPKWTATVAIKNTVEWYKQFFISRQAASEITECQILNYFSA